MPGEYPSDEQIMSAALSGCGDLEDVAYALLNFFDPQVIDELEQDEIVEIGIKKVMALNKCDFETAKALLLQKLTEVNKKDNSIN